MSVPPGLYSIPKCGAQPAWCCPIFTDDCIPPTCRLKETLHKALDQRNVGDFSQHSSPDDSPADMAIRLFRSIIMGEEVSMVSMSST